MNNVVPVNVRLPIPLDDFISELAADETSNKSAIIRRACLFYAEKVHKRKIKLNKMQSQKN